MNQSVKARKERGLKKFSGSIIQGHPRRDDIGGRGGGKGAAKKILIIS
jgi:hypothetical protein